MHAKAGHEAQGGKKRTRVQVRECLQNVVYNHPGPGHSEDLYDNPERTDDNMPR